MIVRPTTISGALIIVPDVHRDQRGYFKETFRAAEYAQAGVDADFVQDNISTSSQGVLRGLHYDFAVTKLVQVVLGRTFHVIADMRPASPTYLAWEGFTLSDQTHEQVFVPPGVANGFFVLSEIAVVHYKQGTYYDPSREQRIRWNDPLLGVKWPTSAPLLSDKDSDVPDHPRA